MNYTYEKSNDNDFQPGLASMAGLNMGEAVWKDTQSKTGPYALSLGVSPSRNQARPSPTHYLKAAAIIFLLAYVWTAGMMYAMSEIQAQRESVSTN